MEGDVVIAKPYLLGAGVNSAITSSIMETRGKAAQKRPLAHSYQLSDEPSYLPDDPRGHVQVRLFTAELAREEAKNVVKEGRGNVDGVLAFEGEFVSGNTTLVCIDC